MDYSKIDGSSVRCAGEMKKINWNESVKSDAGKIPAIYWTQKKIRNPALTPSKMCKKIIFISARKKIQEKIAV